MILFVLTLIFNLNVAQAEDALVNPAPPLRYILDLPQVKSDLLEVNKGCLSRRSTKICDCFMKNFKRKVNGRDITENDTKMAIDVSYRRKEKQYTKTSNAYYFMQDMMESIEGDCTQDPKFEMDLGGDEITKSSSSPKNDKAPASIPKPSK